MAFEMVEWKAGKLGFVEVAWLEIVTVVQLVRSTFASMEQEMAARMVF